MKNPEPFIYSGTDNLEVMAEAVKYNAFLEQLVSRHIYGATRVIDFGAGIGTFSRPFARDGYDILGVEPDSDQRSCLLESGIPCLADISEVSDGWADAIYSVNVLEHIEDDHAVLHLLNAKLKSGGKLFIYVPAFQILYSSMDRKVGHFRRYGRTELNEKVRAAGFRVVESGYADSIGFAASLIFKWLGNDSGDINRSALKIYDRYVFPVSRVLDSVILNSFGKNLALVAEKS
jgi:SAM-dependent methyltransferase